MASTGMPVSDSTAVNSGLFILLRKKNGFFFLQGVISWNNLKNHFFTFLVSLTKRPHFPDDYWFLLTCETKCCFGLDFANISKNYRQPPVLSLLSVFRLISPNFANCSLALHKHAVSDTIRKLSNFARLALSNLAPISFCLAWLPSLSVFGREVYAKNILLWFSGKSYRLCGKIFCFQIRISLLNALVINFWKLAALRRYLTNSG